MCDRAFRLNSGNHRTERSAGLAYTDGWRRWLVPKDERDGTLFIEGNVRRWVSNFLSRTPTLIGHT